uniref:Putative secreted protein n=1 Tax=Panstrongylus lignarius TaxID=156445 RepID=A0A224Y5I2_9HEMI
MSAFWTVVILCAIIRTVLFRETSSRVFCTIFSDSGSSALVASSRIKIDGSLIKALAIAILCFCPPDIVIPRSPRTVS